MLDFLYELGRWLNGTDLHFWSRQTLRTTPWISPTIQSIHIVSVAIVIGAIGFIDLRLLGWAAPSQSPSEMARRLLPWMWVALTLQFLTGTMLILNRPIRYFDNVSFLAKMAMLLTGVVLALVLNHGLKQGDDYWTATPARTVAMKAIAGVSLLLWVLVILAGRWIAYV